MWSEPQSSSIFGTCHECGYQDYMNKYGWEAHDVMSYTMLSMQDDVAGAELTAKPPALIRGERPQVMLDNIKKFIPAWAEAVHDIKDQVEFRKLNGLSNSCYKVSLDKRVRLSDPNAPRTVLYRKIENEVVEKEIEYTIFKSMSDSGQGPKMYGQQEDFRIEGFIESRVLSIWEMRNPAMMDMFVQAIFEMHHTSGTAEAI